MSYTLLKTHVYLFLAVDCIADPLGLYVASLATFQQCHRANLARQGPQGGVRGNTWKFYTEKNKGERFIPKQIFGVVLEDDFKDMFLGLVV